MGGAALHVVWYGWLQPLLLQLSVLAVLVFVLDRLLTGTRFATLRYALWCLLPLRAVLPPGVVSPLGWGVPGIAPSGAGSSGEGALAVVAQSAGPSLAVTAVLAWGVGTLVVLLWAWRRRCATRAFLVRGALDASPHAHAMLARLSQRLGLTRVPRLVRHPCFEGPAVVGAVRPVVVLPAGAATFEDTILEHALLHELAHLKRRDPWAQLAFDLLAALFFFHPLVWVARRRAHALREVCCDLTVAAALGDAAGAYRDTLLRLAAARYFPRSASLPGTSPWMTSGSTLLLRLETLEEDARRRALRSRRPAWVLALALGALLLPAAAPPLRADGASDETTVAEARTLLERTFTERDRYGCFHRRYAFEQWRQAVAAAPPSAD